MDTVVISKTLQKRLPVYLQYLKELPAEVCNISATTIANALGLGEVQVRKDLAKISQEGRRRTGRSRDALIRDIEQCLSGSSTICSILIGSSSMGEVLSDTAGVSILACFDMKPTQKKTVCGKPIYSMKRLEAFCRCYDVHMGIIAVPPESAQAVCDGLVACGVQTIWNFAPVQLKVPSHVVVQSRG